MVPTKKLNSFLLLVACTMALCGLPGVNTAKLSTSITNSTETDETNVTNLMVTNSPNEAESAEEKTAVEPANDSIDLSLWGIVRGLWNWIKSDLSESFVGDAATTDASEGRTFGKIRRLQMALIPIIFKFGVLSAMVAFLVVLGMKTLFLLKILVFMNAAVILGKFLTFKSHLGFGESSQHYGGYNSWSPHATQGWSSTGGGSSLPHNKEIHLHIHGQGQPQVSGYASYPPNNNGWESRSDPYGAYEPTAAASETNTQTELNNAGPIGILPTKYPANHLSY